MNISDDVSMQPSLPCPAVRPLRCISLLLICQNMVRFRISLILFPLYLRLSRVAAKELFQSKRDPNRIRCHPLFNSEIIFRVPELELEE